MGRANVQHRMKWWEPYGATVATSIVGLRSTGVLRVWFWIRVTLIAGVVVAVSAAVMVYSQPGMVLPWPHIAIGLVLWSVVLFVMMMVLSFAPRHVGVRREWIQVSHGQHALRIKRARFRRSS